MPKLTIEQSHSLPQTLVRTRLEALNAKLSEKYGIDAHWKSDTEATIKRTGASGSIKCEATRVVVVIDLSFALTPIKGKVEARIRDELAKALLPEPAAPAGDGDASGSSTA
jgi:putative polyhydroxyalkanoate system protein